jgi:hypothetical protein
MTWMRTWPPATIIACGLVLGTATGSSETGFEGATLLVAAGLSVWMINALYRFGVRGDRERDDEERARTFFDKHGYWPPTTRRHRTQPARAPLPARRWLTADSAIGSRRDHTGTPNRQNG